MSYGSFDATQHQPRQGGQAHPVGKYPFTITDTKIESTKDGQGGMFIVTFTSPSGEMVNRYNLWNNSIKAVEIAHGQLSALCYATGVFRLNFDNAGAELRQARGMMEIGYQKGEEPTAEKPAGGYVELKKVFDANGNEPGKTAPAPSPQQANPAPPWPSSNPSPPATSPVNPNGGAVGWQPQGSQAPPQPPNGPAPAWQQGPTQAAPPWASK
jgi:hypothetical protein